MLPELLTHPTLTCPGHGPLKLSPGQDGDWAVRWECPADCGFGAWS
jgi:hypothetical protein